MQKKQAFLFRIVDIGAELFAMSATVSRAIKVKKEGTKNAEILADIFCANARKRIRQSFKALWSNTDKKQYKLVKEILDDKYLWMEDNIISNYPDEVGEKKEEAPVAKPSEKTIEEKKEEVEEATT